MKILALDTSTKFICLGIADGAAAYEYSLDAAHKHSALLAPSIKRMLDALGWRVRDIDYFACGLGPGSFTGLRLGLAAIKGFAWPNNSPVAGISSLDILAEGAGETGKVIVPVIDAKRSLVYCSIYRAKALKRAAPYMLLTLPELLKKIPPGAVVLGDGAGLYRDKILNSAKGIVILDSEYWYPRPHSLIKLARQRIAAGKLSDAFRIKPIYLYPKECQIRKT